jgi:hypothetical protein
MVRAKFIVEFKGDNHRGGYSTIKLMPVTSGSEENKTFYKWTPGGSIELSTVNPEAAAGFEVGKEYYVDFTLAQ